MISHARPAAPSPPLHPSSPLPSRGVRLARAGLIALGAACGAVCCAPEAAAAPMPADIAAQIARIGPVINLGDTAALYAAPLAARPEDDLRTALDQAYGPDPKQQLDVFAESAAAGEMRPVLVFVHGGGFTGGDKRGEDGSPFYANVGQWAARNGMVGVNLTYRLAPAHPYPAAQEDIGLALAWVRAHVGLFGGDPDRVFLMGHSAGASHVASYVAAPRFPPGAAHVAGVLLVSGFYELGSRDDEAVRAYYGDDAGVRAGRWPSAGLERVEAPILLAYAELDPPEFVEQALRLRDRLAAAGRPPVVAALAGHNHMSEIYSLGTEDTSAADPFLAVVTAR